MIYTTGMRPPFDIKIGFAHQVKVFNPELQQHPNLGPIRTRRYEGTGTTPTFNITFQDKFYNAPDRSYRRQIILGVYEDGTGKQESSPFLPHVQDLGFLKMQMALDIDPHTDNVVGVGTVESGEQVILNIYDSDTNTVITSAYIKDPHDNTKLILARASLQEQDIVGILPIELTPHELDIAGVPTSIDWLETAATYLFGGSDNRLFELTADRIAREPVLVPAL